VESHRGSNSANSSADNSDVCLWHGANLKRGAPCIFPEAWELWPKILIAVWGVLRVSQYLVQQSLRMKGCKLNQ